jgi:hypothetical protein
MAVLAAVSLGFAAALAGTAAPAHADGLTFTNTPTPVTPSQPYVGAILDASVGDWVPTPDNLAYQWYADGNAILGATDAEYIPTSDVQGTHLTVAVTATKVGYDPVTETSVPTAAVGPPHVRPGIPTISGTPDVDSTLTVDPDASNWTPSTGVTFSYQWMRNNSDIANATSSTYTLVKRDAGQLITVRVTGTADGYSSGQGFPSGPVQVSGTGYAVNGTITGLPSSSGTPGALAGVLVELYEGTNPVSLASTYTDGVGHYEFDFGPDDPTATYTLEYNRSAASGDVGADFVHVWLGNQVQRDHATQFTLSPTATTATEDIQLDRAATVTGVVKDSSGAPIPGAFVQATPPGQLGGSYATTDSNGEYTLTRVSSADTIVGVTAESHSGSARDTRYYNPQFWDHSSTAAAATPLIIAPGDSLSGINFDLTDAATISGRIVDGSGSGVPYMTYVPWHWDVATQQYVSPGAGPFVTDADGYFQLDGNSSTSFRLSFVDDLGASAGIPQTRAPFDTVWYDSASSFGAATAVELPDASTRVDLGNIVVTPHEGGPGFAGSPVIQSSQAQDGSVELAGIAATPGTATTTAQWYRDDVAIPGATDYSYLPVPADQGHLLTATVTASLAGFPDATITTAPLDLRNHFVVVTPPAISGTATVGQTLSVTDGTYTPTPDTVAYQWFRQTDAGDPVAIAGATSATYVLTAAAFGDKVSAQVTASASGYDDSVVTTTPLGDVAAGPLTTATPTITGTASVGNLLTADAGTWGPGSVSFVYQWVSGSTDIPGATSSTYTPVAGDAGAILSVRVTGSETGYASNSVASAPTSVGPGTLTTVTPTVSGSAIVGSTLTAAPGTWGPGSVALTYQWINGSTDIAGATSSTYVIVPGDLAAALSVRVTGTETGYTTTSETSIPTGSVAAGAMTTTTPTISGTLTVGSTLTASTTPWGPGTVALAYQWVNGSSDISGATAATYQLVGADLGANISVRVTGTEVGYSTTSTTSTQTTQIGQGTLIPGTPAITGAVAVGSTLTATRGSWIPTGITFTYQWVNSVTGDIPGATSAGYVVTPADYQAKLSFRVTGTKVGYTTTSVTSAQTVSVAAGTMSASTPTITGSPAVGVQLTAVPGTWGPGTVSLAYQWVNGSTDIAGATSSTYTPVVGDLGATISVRVTGTETGYATTSASSTGTAAVGNGALTAGTPTISGTPIFNSTLTANPDATHWGPGTVALTYQWFRGGTLVAGQTNSTYLPGVLDVGATITVAVTGTETGYTATTTTSAGKVIAPATFAATAAPTISGPTSALHRLNAQTPGWSPDPDAFTYVWMRDGAGISGAPDSPTYQLTPDDVGHSFTLQVIGHKGGYAAVQSPVSGAVPVNTPFSVAFVNNELPTITGQDMVGSTLSTTTGSWTPTPTSYTYIWQRGTGDPNGADGSYATIPGATDNTYMLTPSDLNLSITVRVTPVRSGYIGTRPAEQTDPIQSGPLTSQAPTISGSATVGSTLTASTSGWGPGTVSFAYVWKRSGTPITGATASTYRLAAADLNSQISVQVTGSETGYNSSIQTSATTAQIGPGSFTATPAPTITGTVAPGNTLTAVDPTWLPATAFIYQWLRGTTPISGATSKTYLVDPADSTSVLSVTVTSTLPGYNEQSQTSSPTTTVGAAVLPALPRPTITGTARVGSTLSVAAPHLSISPVGLTFTYHWRTGTTLLQTSTAGTYIPTHSDVGHTISVYIVASASGYLATSTSPTSSSTAKVVVGSLTAPTPTISGTAKVNNTLTAITGAWTAGSTLKYQWYRSGIAITGKTAPTYLTTGSDYRHTITVKVSGSLSGYTSAWRMSHSTATIVAGTITTATPTITGTLAYPSTLTANRGTWGPGSISFSYQWYYTSSSGMHAITNAVHSTYAPSSAYAGLTITVHIRGSKSGYTSATRTASVQYARGTFTTATPTILGTPDVGSTLTASRGAWSPTSSVTFSYQWYCGTDVSARVAISGATASTFVVPSSLLGKTVWVTVRSSRSGFTTAGPVLSAASGPIAPKP